MTADESGARGAQDTRGLGALTHQSARDQAGIDVLNDVLEGALGPPDRATALERARNDLAWASGALDSLADVAPEAVAKALRALERVDALLEGLEREADDARP